MQAVIQNINQLHRESSLDKEGQVFQKNHITTLIKRQNYEQISHRTKY